MPMIMPEIVVRRLLELGFRELRQNTKALIDLYSQYNMDELGVTYGEDYINKIVEWFKTTDIPVISSWAWNSQQVPCVTVHLSSESEDQDKAALNDYVGNFDTDPDSTTGIGVMTSMIDIGIRANRSSDQVLWLYYAVVYCLFRYKPAFERFGLKLHTFSASDYTKAINQNLDSVWTRFIRFKCTTQSFWAAEEIPTIEEINTTPKILSSPSQDVATTGNIQAVNTSYNEGIKVSRIGTDDDFVL
jgi:hypothetical protein